MSKSSPPNGRVERSRFQLLIAMVGALAGITVALVSIRMDSSPLTLAIAVGGFVLSIVSLQASQRWWKEADEAVREAHKSGWFWGGSTGLGVAGGLMAIMFALEPDISLRQFALFPGDAGLVGTGLAVAILLSFIGYGIAWAIWWLRNR